MKKGPQLHWFICVAFGIVCCVLMLLNRHIINIDVTPFFAIWVILMISDDLHRKMKKGLQIHWFICVAFGIVFCVLMFLNRHIINIDVIPFLTIWVILLLSYLLHRFLLNRAIAKKKS